VFVLVFPRTCQAAEVLCSSLLWLVFFLCEPSPDAYHMIYYVIYILYIYNYNLYLYYMYLSYIFEPTPDSGRGGLAAAHGGFKSAGSSGKST
jgi:hypothetical protein